MIPFPILFFMRELTPQHLKLSHFLLPLPQNAKTKTENQGNKKELLRNGTRARERSEQKETEPKTKHHLCFFYLLGALDTIQYMYCDLLFTV